ncbi:hypothetical protein M501DRAFT_1003445 [Patellaria atrata CBS 101060]|uniref:PD-(D/E)XK nuclease-like domain-containing protein n=1 Tax=Patellaria atrata CBS 101060 TaxID=1346257 RepID=A0A9P4SCP1_9PEZI|nr:hypothetical protein M501DRAFT_1003445 [Patellaria atrata CBS 101060]
MTTSALLDAETLSQLPSVSIANSSSSIIHWLSETELPNKGKRKMLEPTTANRRPRTDNTIHDGPFVLFPRLHGPATTNIVSQPSISSHHSEPSRFNDAPPLSSGGSVKIKSSASRGHTTIKKPINASRSPVKKFTSLSRIPGRITYNLFGDAVSHLYEGVNLIRTKLKQVGDGKCIIPESFKGPLSTYEFPNECIHLACNGIVEDGTVFASDEVRNIYGPCPSIDRIIYVFREAIMCETNRHAEASWNNMVHSPLLQLALWNQTYFHTVEIVP